MGRNVIAVTGATGQLGRLVVSSLLERVPASCVVAAVRNPETAADLRERGVEVRVADYDRPATLDGAFAGVDKVLLISGNMVGQRVRHHGAVIDAVRRAGAGLLCYTSILRADDSPLTIAGDHRETERSIRDSGVPYVVLRNGWYTENYTTSLPAILERSAVLGCAGEGRISAAARRDYAEGAAVVLASGESQAGKVYELAGDDSFTLAEFALEVGRQTGREIAYRDMSEAEYAGMLATTGLSRELAAVLAGSEAGISMGGLFDDSRSLSALIGRPTTPARETIAAALRH